MIDDSADVICIYICRNILVPDSELFWFTGCSNRQCFPRWCGGGSAFHSQNTHTPYSPCSQCFWLQRTSDFSVQNIHRYN